MYKDDRDPQAAADAIREDMHADFGPIALRDQAFLDQVLMILDLPRTDDNRKQAAALCNAKKIKTHLEFPKAKYDPDGNMTVVKDPDEEAALGAGWTDTPPAKDAKGRIFEPAENTGVKAAPPSEGMEEDAAAKASAAQQDAAAKDAAPKKKASR